MSDSIRLILSQGDVYLGLFAWLALAMIIELFYENEILARWMARFGAILIILLIGLRWDTGTDWLPYLRVFYTNNSSSDYDSVVFGIDQGYVAFNRLMIAISDNYTTFLLVDAIIAVGAVYIFIEKSTRLPNMGVYLFYTSYVTTHFMGSNRRMIAIGFVCLGFLALRRPERLWAKWSRWAIPFGAAATFHRTSLVALLGLTVSRRAWPAWAVALGLLTCLGLGISGAPFAALEALGGTLSQYTGITLVEKLIFYTSNETQVSAEFNVARQAALGVARRSSTLAILMLYMKFGKPDEYAAKLYNIFIIGCSLYFLMVGSPIFQIISTYYSMVEIVLLPIVFFSIPKLKVPYTLYLIVFPFLLLLSALTPYANLYVPYRSTFEAY